MAYLEALSCGTPVVGAATNIHELTEALGICCGEPVAKPEVREVIRACRRVESGEWDRRELHVRTVGRFGIDRVAESYVEHLRAVASR